LPLLSIATERKKSLLEANWLHVAPLSDEVYRLALLWDKTLLPVAEHTTPSHLEVGALEMAQVTPLSLE